MEIDGKKVEAKRPVKESNVMCCRACLATDCKLYNMHEQNLVTEFVRVSGFDVIETEKFPKYLCVWCTSLLRSCAVFRDKCRRATMCLLPELREGDLIIDSIRVIDRYTNKLVSLMQTKVEITDSLDIPMMLQDQLQAISQLDYKKRSKKEDEPVVKGNNKPENDLYLQIDSADTHGIKINVVNDNILPKETISETITEDMFDTEYLDDFENVPASRFTKINPDVNKSVELDCEIREEYIGKAAKRNYAPRIRPVHCFKEFETTCNVDLKKLTQAEQLAEIESQRNSTSYKEALYQCHPCGRHFKFKDTLDRHLAKHNKEAGDHECPVCTLRHLSKAALIAHIERKHHFKITCKECGLVSTTKFKARQHHEWHNGTKFKCDYCGKVFDNVSTCFSHIRVAHPTMNKACNMCGETFINDKGLNWHKTRAHGVPLKEKHLICKTCSVKFISLDALEKHKDTAGADADLTPCIQCGENFDSEEKMQEHSMSEHPVCKECNMTFITHASYNTHVLRKHQGLGWPGDKRSVFPRPPPPRPPRQHPPRQHPPGFKSQSQPAPACCEQCGKMFRYASLLQQHQMISHDGINPFTCNICLKTFLQKISLFEKIRKT